MFITFQFTCTLTTETGLGDRAGLCPVAEKAYSELISLPMFHGMMDSDVDDVVEAVDKVLSYFFTGIR